MSKLKTHPALKAGAVLLTILLIFTLFFSTVAVGLFCVLGAYSDPEGFRDDVSTELSYEEANKVENYFYQLNEEMLSNENEKFELPQQLKAENTNLRFTVTDTDGNTVLTNEAAPHASANSYTFGVVINRTTHSESRSFYHTEDASAFIDEKSGPTTDITDLWWDSDVDEEGVPVHILTINWEEFTEKEFEIAFSIASPLTVEDSIYHTLYWLDLLIDLRWTLVAVSLISLMLTIFLLVYLCWAAGHRKGSQISTPNLIDRIPFDLYLAVAAGLVTSIVITWHFLLEEVAEIDNPDLQIFFLVITVLFAIILSGLLVSLILTVAARVKCRILIKNTLIWRFLRILWKGVCYIGRFIGFYLKNLPLYWKSGLVICALVCLELFVLLSESFEFFLICWIFGNLLLIPVALYCIIQFKRLTDAAKHIAEGDTAYQLNTNGMIVELKTHAQTLNGIGAGLQKAVDERMKSERFKTELITNVSHDIKTPLTSIINYVDLLKKEEIESEVVNEYIGVLDRQSARLKKLIEDLVEASKASTGNITVNEEKLDLNLLVSQTTAEFHDKLIAKDLTVITNLAADQNCMVTADGRLVWRVLENLMSNICKYAQEHTRVYVNTTIMDNAVRITLKNTSKYALNITSEELMERFTRGDASRHTEGSGLGLSIARSLVELQKGSFDIVIDGDLFKVMIDLPRA